MLPSYGTLGYSTPSRRASSKASELVIKQFEESQIGLGRYVIRRGIVIGLHSQLK
jgi:hypothetical protein